MSRAELTPDGRDPRLVPRNWRELIDPAGEWHLDADGLPRRRGARVIALRTVPRPAILLVTGHDRTDAGHWWSFTPGGGVQEGETSRQAAARELAEETDHEAATWHTLVDYYASPGFTTEGCRSFLARGLSLLPDERRVPREAEEAELVPTWFRVDDVVAAVLEGRIHNPATVTGVLAADRLRARGWEGLREADAPWLRSPVSL